MISMDLARLYREVVWRTVVRHSDGRAQRAFVSPDAHGLDQKSERGPAEAGRFVRITRPCQVNA